MDWRKYIEQRPDVLGGKPVFKGTRIGVQMVLEERAAGSSEQELLAAYPTLQPEHISAAYDYAAKVIGTDQTLFVSESRA
jgi:uncharacterized protein (DUF433 family)